MTLEEQYKLTDLLKDKPELLDHPMINDRSKEIFKARWGLIDGKRRSLAEVGKLHGVTRERIRQIEGKVLEIITLILKDLDKNSDGKI